MGNGLTRQYIITRLRLLALLIVAQSAKLATPVAVFHILTGRDEKAMSIIRALDRLGNAGLSGNDREMLSYRAKIGMQAGRRRWCILCRLLSLVDKRHCEKATP